MRRGPRPTRTIVALCVAALLGATATGVPWRLAAGAAASAGGLSMIQYAPSGPGSGTWIARRISGANPVLAAGGGPRAAADGTGGVQVAYKNAHGDLIWLDGASVGRFRAVDLTRLLGFAPLLGQPVPVVSSHGLDEVFCVTQTGHLLQLTYDPYRRLPGATGRTARSTRGRAPTSPTRPARAGPARRRSWCRRRSPRCSCATRAASLLEFASDHKAGRVWNAYDLTAISGAPRVATDPVAFLDPGSHEVRVAATDRTRGAVVLYLPNDVGGRMWNYQNVSAVTKTAPATGGIAGGVYQGQPVLFVAGRAGDLTEFVGADAGRSMDWAATDVTSATPGSPAITATPSVAVEGSRLVVAGVAAEWGDLFEWQASAVTGPFQATDVSQAGQGPTRTAAGTPAVVVANGGVSVFAAGAAVPAPEGTGLYGAPTGKWAQALKDGWEVLGVTGGLAQRCAPWTGYANPRRTRRSPTPTWARPSRRATCARRGSASGP